MADPIPVPTTVSAPQLIDLRAAARLESSGRGGRPPHISSICRWIQQGVRLRSGGRLRLQAVRVPSGWRTTREWLEEFHQALTADRLGRDLDGDAGAVAATAAPSTGINPTGRRSAAERRAANRRAARLLEQMGC